MSPCPACGCSFPLTPSRVFPSGDPALPSHARLEEQVLGWAGAHSALCREGSTALLLPAGSVSWGWGNSPWDNWE